MAQRDDELLPTRVTLLERLRDWKDQASWQEFFDTYWKLIYGVARKSGLGDAEAQDVVQETMSGVAKHMPSFQYNPALGSFKAWLLNLTRWRIIDQARKRPPASVSVTHTGLDGPATALIDQIIDPASADLDAVWEREWERNLFNAAVTRVKRRVDPQKYQMFDLYVNQEWAADKVAATFGVAVDQVYLIKHRITEMLRDEIHRLGQETT